MSGNSKLVDPRQAMGDLSLLDTVLDERLAAVRDACEENLLRVMGQDGYAQYLAIVAERDAALAQAQADYDAKAADLTEKIKFSVVHYQGTFKGGNYQCVFVEPGPKWDGKKLDKFAADGHPELWQFKVPGSVPYARLGKVKN